MSFGTARRGWMHALGDSSGGFVPRWRVIAACVVAKGKDGRNHHCYHGDLIDWLSDDEAERFTRLKLVEPIDADAQDDLDDTEDTDAGPADSDAVSECVATLDRLSVPTTAGAPACRTALRGNGYRHGNNVVAAAVKRRKGLSKTDADAEDFETVVP
jgi:hypothetical protein